MSSAFNEEVSRAYYETQTEEEKQFDIPQKLIDRTRKYIGLCERYGVDYNGESFLFADIKSMADREGLTPVELVKTYRYPLEIIYEIPFEVVFVGIDNARRFDGDLEPFINAHIRNVKTWLQMSKRKLGHVLGDRDIPPEV
jgi:hypothetical protein